MGLCGFLDPWPAHLCQPGKDSPGSTGSRGYSRQIDSCYRRMEETFQALPGKDFPHLQQGLASYFYDWMGHPTADDYWKRWRIEDHHSRMMVPALNIGGWHDIFLKGTLRNFLGMKTSGSTEEVRNGQKLIVGPWHHASPGSGRVRRGVLWYDGRRRGDRY